MKKVIQYLSTLDKETLHGVIALMNEEPHTDGDGGDPSACSGCEKTTPNGSCRKVNEVCVWVPEIGG